MKFSYITFFLLIHMLFIGNGYSQETIYQLNMDYFKKNYFDSVELDGTHLILKFKPLGRRFLYSINGGDFQKSNYGEIITLPMGSTLKIVERHGSITFETIPKAIKEAVNSGEEMNGFLVEAKTDRRSIGGKVIIEKAFMVQNKKSLSVEKTEKNMNPILFVEPTIDALRKAIK
jgi:hypothetical protein